MYAFINNLWTYQYAVWPPRSCLTASRRLSMLSNKFSNSSVSLFKSFKTLWTWSWGFQGSSCFYLLLITSGSLHFPWECFQMFSAGLRSGELFGHSNLWRNQSRQACLELHWPSILGIFRFHEISSTNECDFLLVRLFHIPMHLIRLCSEFHREYFAIYWF